MAQPSYERLSSPYLELKPNLKNEIQNYQFIQNREKIHRIRTRSSFLAEITYVTSPSEIWVRPINNIANKLTIPFSNAPKLEQNVNEDVYVMTPFDEDVLVRARIILFNESKERYLLRLIDHGKPVWRDAEDIFEMTDEIRKYPWQAIPIILQGVKPITKEEWTETEVYTLNNATTEFQTFFVIPTLYEDSVLIYDSVYTRASINGWDKESLETFQKLKYEHKQLEKKKEKPINEIGFSLAEYYHMLLPSDLPATLSSQAEPIMAFDKQKPYPYPLQYDDSNEIEYQCFNHA